MTPKEKAKELVNKFYFIIPLDKMTIDFNLAKNCALIAVDEIIEELAFMWCGYGGFEDILDERQAYYIEVKQEIEKI